MLNPKKLLRSFKFAWRGVTYAFNKEQNFRIQLLAAAVVLFLIGFLKIPAVEASILILVISLVLTLELLNTIFERFADILSPRVHKYVEIIKDLMAATVLISSVAAVIIGALILWPYIG